MAGIFAFKEAMKNMGPILLEPIMKVEVTTPEEFQGDIIGDLNRRRGHIQNMESKGDLATTNRFRSPRDYVWLRDGRPLAFERKSRLFDGTF